MVIGQAEIDELENIIFDKFGEFSELFREQHGSDVLDPRNYPHINPIWTCFINGKGKGYQFKGWEGIFRIWMKGIIAKAVKDPDHAKNLKIVPETWYRVDMAVVDYSQGNWWDGKYRIEVLFQQENNPREIAGHLREFYDFTAPNKILLIWTGQSIPDPGEVLKRTDEVASFCAKNAIENVGTIAVIIGDWQRTKSALEKAEKPADSIFTTRTIG